MTQDHGGTGSWWHIVLQDHSGTYRIMVARTGSLWHVQDHGGMYRIMVVQDHGDTGSWWYRIMVTQDHGGT